MTREEIIEIWENCKAAVYNDADSPASCPFKDKNIDCDGKLMDEAVEWLKHDMKRFDNGPQEKEQKKAAWEAHDKCNPKCIYWKEDLTPDCVCHKCIGTLGSENRWARDDYYEEKAQEDDTCVGVAKPDNKTADLLLPHQTRRDEIYKRAYENWPMEQNNTHDPVNHPSHYTSGGIECIDAIEAAISVIRNPVSAFLTGQVLKYMWRWSQKNKEIAMEHKPMCFTCKHQNIYEASHEWIECKCQKDGKVLDPFDGCEEWAGKEDNA